MNYPSFYKLASLIIFCIFNVIAYSEDRFLSKYQCSDNQKTCLEAGSRMIDGFEESRCWKFKYAKTCNYPSKNNCSEVNHCYLGSDLSCLLKDEYGKCVNFQKKFYCRVENKKINRKDLATKTKNKKLICSTALCSDGNCFDKSYMLNDEMMDSISKLQMVGQMKNTDGLDSKLFPGFCRTCSKKVLGYTRCCSEELDGWGSIFGAECTQDEKSLIDLKTRNLCIYVGEKHEKILGLRTFSKHYFCCFGNLLNKVIQVEGRKQLGLTFGSYDNPNCRGLTFKEIEKLKFDEMDFSEFFTEIEKSSKIPVENDVKSRVKSAAPSFEKIDSKSKRLPNKKSGISTKLKNEAK